MMRDQKVFFLLQFDFIGSLNIRRIGESIKKLYLEDWFHSFASLSTTSVILSILLAVNYFTQYYIFDSFVVFRVNFLLGVYVLYLSRLWIY